MFLETKFKFVQNTNLSRSSISTWGGVGKESGTFTCLLAEEVVITEEDEVVMLEEVAEVVHVVVLLVPLIKKNFY